MTMENPNESFLQGILDLSYDTIKYSFLHFGGSISEFCDLKKCTVEVEITQWWGQRITKEGEILIKEAKYILGWYSNYE